MRFNMELNPIHHNWNLNIAALILSVFLTVIFYRLGGFSSRRKTLFFCLATGLLLAVNCLPLQAMARHHVFTAHMIIHVVLLLLCGPLLVSAMPVKPDHRSGYYCISAFLRRHSWIAWFVGVGIMWFWHIPAVHDATARQTGSNGFLNVLELVSLPAAGFIFSWPLTGPYRELHIHPLNGIIYLVTACVSCSLLGLLIAFAPPGIYHSHASPSFGTTTTGLMPEEDQKMAGLIMWVPCCLVYLGGCLLLLLRWFAETGEKLLDNITEMEERYEN